MDEGIECGHGSSPSQANIQPAAEERPAAGERHPQEEVAG
jgi:hypothetical protein